MFLFFSQSQSRSIKIVIFFPALNILLVGFLSFINFVDVVRQGRIAELWKYLRRVGTLQPRHAVMTGEITLFARKSDVEMLRSFSLAFSFSFSFGKCETKVGCWKMKRDMGIDRSWDISLVKDRKSVTASTNRTSIAIESSSSEE